MLGGERSERVDRSGEHAGLASGDRAKRDQGRPEPVLPRALVASDRALGSQSS